MGDDLKKANPTIRIIGVPPGEAPLWVREKWVGLELPLTRHSACMGLSLSRGRHAILVVLCIPFFCSTRAASILPSRPHISIAVARSGSQGRRFFSAAEGLSLTDASAAAGCRRSGGWPRDDPRGACHWPRSIANHACIRLNPMGS